MQENDKTRMNGQVHVFKQWYKIFIVKKYKTNSLNHLAGIINVNDSHFLTKFM